MNTTRESNNRHMNCMKSKIAACLAVCAALIGCNVQDIPPAHKGMEFDVGIMSSSDGFVGSVLNAGSHSLSLNNEIYQVQCEESSVKEQFPSNAADGVEFPVDVHVRFAANCEDGEAVQWLLQNVQPNPPMAHARAKEVASQGSAKAAESAIKVESAFLQQAYLDKTVISYQLYKKFLRPILGQSVRDAIATRGSDIINTERDAIGKEIVKSFRDRVTEATTIGKDKVSVIRVAGVNMSRIIPPESMRKRNEELANVKTQTKIQKNTRAKVEEEILTEQKQQELAMVKVNQKGAEVEEIGKRISQNPGYLRYLQIQNQKAAIAAWPKAFEGLGKGHATVMFGDSDPTMLLLGLQGAAK